MLQSVIAWGDGRPSPAQDFPGAIAALSESENYVARTNGEGGEVGNYYATTMDQLSSLKSKMDAARIAGLVSFATLDVVVSDIQNLWADFDVQGDPIARFLVADYLAFVYYRAADAYLDGAGNPLPRYTVAGRVAGAVKDAGNAVGDGLKTAALGGGVFLALLVVVLVLAKE